METRGIDISSYQGKIDWLKVKDEGIDFVLIRAGWGSENTDPRFKKNIEDALNVNLNVGVYWYLYGKTENDMIANAEKCDSIIAPYKQAIRMNVWADWQYDSDTYAKSKRLAKQDRTDLVKKFCDVLTERGYNVGIFADELYIDKKFGDISNYPLWYSHCATSVGKRKPLIWQKSFSGKINGIVPKVNINEYLGEKVEVYEPIKLPKSYPRMVLGDKSIYVKVFISRLKELGYDIAKFPKAFTPEVQSYVIQFQKDKGIKADGIVGPETWEALYK